MTVKKLIIILVGFSFGLLSTFLFGGSSFGASPTVNSNQLAYNAKKYQPPTRSQPPPRGRSPIQQSRRSQAITPKGWEVGINFGTSHSLTEIGGSSEVSRGFIMDTQFKATSVNLGAFGKYRFNEFGVVEVSFNYGHINGADSLSPTSSSRYHRGFYFHNDIYELAVKGEVYAPKFWHKSPLDIYGYLGMAVFYHNPVLTVPDPESLAIEEFDNYQIAFPIGVGATVTFAYFYKVGLDIGWRKTFTNYLNGFTRPASTGYNSYYFTAIKMSYFFDRRPVTGRHFYR